MYRKYEPSPRKFSKTRISERPIDEHRPLKLVYIGAGISGIVGAIEFLMRIPTLELVIYEKNPQIGGTWYENRYPGCACGMWLIVIYEKNPQIGGTWYENRYPGCACDVPSHAYQLSFKSYPRWSEFFAGAPEILQYWKDIVEEYDIRKRIRFERKCIGARWSDVSSKWFVQVRDLKTGSTFEEQTDIFMVGEGILNEWTWPSIPGIDSFKGKLIHSADWDVEFNPKDKAVAVIGAGGSGVQIVPNLLPVVKYIDHYVRGRTWISNQYGGDDLLKRTDGKGGNFSYTDAEKTMWENDRDAYLAYRRSLEQKMQGRFGITQRGSPLLRSAKKQYTADMRERLKEKPEIMEYLLPDFPPLCKRLTPGPGYLEALTDPKVNVIPTAISHIDERGIITTDGVHHPVDAIVCATGFMTSPGARGFPIYGRDGVNLRERYLDRPESYLGLCTDGFPNFFQSLGPNSFAGAGNLLIQIEYIHKYVGQILTKFARGNLGVIEPKKRVVQNFTNFCEEYFKRTVFSEACNSWYKTAPAGATPEERAKSRVTALWPGSSVHAVRTLEHVRWEDFEMQEFDGNEFGWFGNGWTIAEKDPETNVDNLTFYLDNTTLLKPERPLVGGSKTDNTPNGHARVDSHVLPTENTCFNDVFGKDGPSKIESAEVPTGNQNTGLTV